MKNSINNLKATLTENEKISTEKLASVKGGCALCSDPKRCDLK
jgi:hypothetical protein